MDYKISDFIDPALEKVRKFLKRYLNQTEDTATRENELKLTLAVYLCLNLIMYFFVPGNIFIYWLLVNIFIALIIKSIFFPNSVEKVKGLERFGQAAPVTFFEGGFFQVSETIIENKAQAPKKADKKLNETFELKSEKPSPNRSFTSIRGTSHPNKPQKSPESQSIVEEKEPILTESFDINTITKQVPDLRQPSRKDLFAISEVLTESVISDIGDHQSHNNPRAEVEDDLMSIINGREENVVKTDWLESSIKPTPADKVVSGIAAKTEENNKSEMPFPQAQSSVSPFLAELTKNFNDKPISEWGVFLTQQAKPEQKEADIWNNLNIDTSQFLDLKTAQSRGLFTDKPTEPALEADEEKQSDNRQEAFDTKYSTETRGLNGIRIGKIHFSDKEEESDDIDWSSTSESITPAFPTFGQKKLVEVQEVYKQSPNKDTSIRHNIIMNTGQSVDKKEVSQTGSMFTNRSTNSSFGYKASEGQENLDLNQKNRVEDIVFQKGKAVRAGFKPHSTTAKMHSLLARSEDDE